VTGRGLAVLGEGCQTNDVCAGRASQPMGGTPSCTAGERQPVTVSTCIPLTAVYEPVENGWIQARIEELPGVVTAGATAGEARDLLLDALRRYLLVVSLERRRDPRHPRPTSACQQDPAATDHVQVLRP
jgi:hypothetical protein